MNFFRTLPDGSELVAKSDSERVESRQADQTWRATDVLGHEHYWCAGSDPYPTLLSKSQCDFADHDDECIGHRTFECRECGKAVTPGTVTSHETITYRSRCELRVSRTVDNALVTTVYDIDEDRGKALLGEIAVEAGLIVDRYVADATVVSAEMQSS